MQKGINVLSVFNGMGCIWIALDALGIKVNKRYSCEIDPYANIVNDANYPDTIQLGDIRGVKGKDLESIDLLVGGSPCQGFSFAGKQLNFDDPRSVLFFEFYRLLEECDPVHFLLENVKMSKISQEIINSYLITLPEPINSSLFTAQNRPRLYWTDLVIEPILDAHIFIKDIIDKKTPHVYIGAHKTINREYKRNCLQYDINGKGHGSQDQRAYYLEGKHGCLDTGAASKAKILIENGKVRKTSLIEAERLQGIPPNYFKGVSEAQAFKMLGNGWTVPVIQHILKSLPYA